MADALNFVLKWPLPSALFLKGAVEGRAPAFAIPAAAGVGVFWWQNGGFAFDNLMKLGKSYLLAGLAAYAGAQLAIGLEAQILRREMGDEQSRSSAR